MATVVLTDGVFVLNSVDLSDHCTKITLDIGGAELDASVINSSWDVNKLGRKNFSVSFECLDDFAASNVDATIWGAFNTGTAVTMSFKATSAANSATNPQYSGSVIPSKSPVGGGAGELLKKSVTFKGTGALSRATS